jgi:hypothetical protein
MTSSLAFLNDVSCFQLTKIMQILSVVSTRLAGGIVLLLLLGVSVAAADELALRWKSASGDVVAERSLALDDLDALPQVTLETSTPWTEGKSIFSGVSLSDLAALASAGQVINADLVALNDYMASVPAEDWRAMTLVLASRINGKTMPVYDKGPFWLVYPVDDLEKPLAQAYVARMVWQVASITFHVR